MQQFLLKCVAVYIRRVLYFAERISTTRAR